MSGFFAAVLATILLLSCDYIPTITPYEYQQAVDKCATHRGLLVVKDLSNVLWADTAQLTVLCNDQTTATWRFKKEKK